MKQLALEFGLYNTTFWMALACFGSVLLKGRLPAAHWRWWKPLAFTLIVGSALNLGIGLGRAFLSPRDFLQDIVSAKEYLAGRSMYPDGMNGRFAELLAEEKINREISLGGTIDQLSKHSREATLEQHWVQAHPPFMSIFFAGLYSVFGVLGTQAALAAISLLCLMSALTAIVVELKPEWGFWRTVAIAAAVCGASPVVMSFRNGQADAILLTLVAAAWILLRHGRCLPAGVAIGLAISFKLIPAIVLPLLLIRWRKAFFGAIVTLGMTTTIIVFCAGAGTLAEYRQTAEGVIAEYARYPSNISLLGFFTRGFHLLGMSPELAPIAWKALGVLIFGTLMFLGTRRTDINRPNRDFDRLMGFAVCLMPLCSPVAWDHYITFLILPLALASGAMPRLLLALIVLLFAFPETAYLNLLDLCRTHELSGLAVWLIAPLRTYAIAALACWFAISRESCLRDSKVASEDCILLTTRHSTLSTD